MCSNHFIARSVLYKLRYDFMKILGAFLFLSYMDSYFTLYMLFMQFSRLYLWVLMNSRYEITKTLCCYYGFSDSVNFCLESLLFSFFELCTLILWFSCCWAHYIHNSEVFARIRIESEYRIRWISSIQHTRTHTYTPNS